MHTGHGIAPAPKRAGKSPEPDRRPETSRAESQFQDLEKTGPLLVRPRQEMKCYASPTDGTDGDMRQSGVVQRSRRLRSTPSTDDADPTPTLPDSTGPCTVSLNRSLRKI